MSGRKRAVPSVMAAAAVCLGALTGCTGDDTTELVVDREADATTELAAAVDRTSASSGRVRTTLEWQLPSEGDAFASMDSDGEPGATAGQEPGLLTVRLDGEFAGPDLRATVSSEMDGAGESAVDVLVVDGAAYSSADAPMWALLPPTGFSDALAGRRWIEQTTPEGSGDTGAGLEQMGLGIAGPADTLELLGSLARVERTDPVDVDGVTMQSFRGEGDADLLAGDLDSTGSSPGMEEMPEADRLRLQRIERYRNDRISAHVEVLVDPDGLLRRARISITDSVEEQYPDCIHLLSEGSATITIEYRDLGAPIDIEAPDPAEVVNAAEYQQLLDEWLSSAATESVLSELPEPDPSERQELEQLVRDGASSIGLDPSTIADMSGPQLFEALERIWSAEETAPKVPTALGDMTRVELLWHVRAGMEREGVDPSLADGLSDQQLADLIDGYMAAPELAAKIPEGYTVDSDPGDPGVDGVGPDPWMFEGCPE